MNNELPSIIASDAQRSSFAADHAKIGNAYISNLIAPGLVSCIGEFDGGSPGSISSGATVRLSSGSLLIDNGDIGDVLINTDVVVAFPVSTKEVRMVFVWDPATPVPSTTHMTFKVWKRVKSTIDPFPVSWVVAGESAAFASDSVLDAYTLAVVLDNTIVTNTPMRITLQQQFGEAAGAISWAAFQGNFNAVF